jgi:isopentenyl diphosphate isomerase/L-lactate dehydrogenase-like FMN-dependent dehydrogenase
LGVFNNARRKSSRNNWYIAVLLYLTLVLLVILGPKFFHIYLTAPTDIIQKLVLEADKKGYRAIVVTCDDPTSRVRDNILPLFLEASKHIDPTLFQIVGTPNINMHDVEIEPKLNKIPVTWTNIERLRKLTRLPIICKGILSPIDAELAIQCGANGIIVRFISTLLSLIE